MSGEPALQGEFANCNRCGQRVSNAVLMGGRCAACRTMRRVSTSDPSLTAILAAHPGLAKLKHWRLAETGHVYLLRGGKLLASYFLVFDRLNLQVLRALRLAPLSGMRLGPLSGGQSELSTAEQQALLGG